MNYPRRMVPSRRQLLKAGVAGGAALALAGVVDRAGLASAARMGGYPPRNPQVAGEKATLAVWLTPELAAHSAYKRAISLFQRAYPSLTVAVTPVAKSDIPARLKVAIAGGGAPDLVSHHAYIFGAQGLAHESDALWYAWGQEAAFLPGAMRDVQWRNDKFGVPLAGNAILTLLNAEMFARAGASLPTGATTFDQFTALVQRVKRHAGSPYALLLSADGTTATAVVHANGARLMQTVAGRNIARLSDPRVAQALRFYTELGWKRRLAPLPPSGPTNRLYLAQLFAARRAPAFFGTMADLALIEAAAPDLRVAVAPLPGGATGHTAGSVSDGLSLFVPAPSHRPHAAFELAKWLVAEPPALAVARTLRLAPTVARYYENPYFHHDALSRAYFTAAQTALPIGLDAYAEAYDIYLGVLRASFGGQDAARALAAERGACRRRWIAPTRALRGTARVALALRWPRATTREARRRGAVRGWSEHLAAYSLIAPALAVLTLYVFVPIGYTVWISFQDLHLGVVTYTGAAHAAGGYVNPNAHTGTTFFGLRNWTHLLSADPVFRLALGNTAVMTGGATLLGTAGALAAALLLSARLPLLGLFRTAYFFPAAISQVVAGLVFLWLFDENFGLVNHLLSGLGLGPIYWQDDARALLNSVAYAGVSVLTNLGLSLPAGYAFARLRFPLRRTLFALVVVAMMVPTAAIVIPLFVVVRLVAVGGGPLGWLNTYQGLILPTAVTGLSIVLVRQFLRQMPRELDEAARLDGCGPYTTLWWIILPLSGPAIASVATLTFLTRWDDYLWPSVAGVTPDMFTLQVGLRFLEGASAQQWPLLMASCTLAALPVLLLYVALQPLFDSGLASLGTGWDL